MVVSFVSGNQAGEGDGEGATTKEIIGPRLTSKALKLQSRKAPNPDLAHLISSRPIEPTQQQRGCGGKTEKYILYRGFLQPISIEEEAVKDLTFECCGMLCEGECVDVGIAKRQR